MPNQVPMDETEKLAREKKARIARELKKLDCVECGEIDAEDGYFVESVATPNGYFFYRRIPRREWN